MVVPHLRCRTQRFEFVCVEVDVQPDREDAERDDAGVEVAAHPFFCEPCARLAPPRALCVAAVVKTLFAVAFDPNSSSCSHQTHVRGM